MHHISELPDWRYEVSFTVGKFEPIKHEVTMWAGCLVYYVGRLMATTWKYTVLIQTLPFYGWAECTDLPGGDLKT